MAVENAPRGGGAATRGVGARGAGPPRTPFGPANHFILLTQTADNDTGECGPPGRDKTCRGAAASLCRGVAAATPWPLAKIGAHFCACPLDYDYVR